MSATKTTLQSPPEQAMQELFAPTAAVEAYMNEWLDERPLPGNLREATRYALLGPGKRLRPILVIRCCEAVGGQAEQAMPAAAAMEMIHTFSLVHDDLPAMDNDDLRRGRPTLHKHTNEAMAILAGDLMLGLAFELVACKMPAGQAAGVMRELAMSNNDMIAGQVWDTLPDFGPEVPALKRLQTIHHHKTGALIRASCRIGAMCGQASERELAAINQYGAAIGLMFQVIDDIIDVTQSTEHLGKTAGKDVALNKLTYPALIGLEASRAEVVRLHQEASQALQSLGTRGSMLQNLCDYMAVRTR